MPTSVSEITPAYAYPQTPPIENLFDAIVPVEQLDGVVDAAIWMSYPWADEPRNHGVVVVVGDDKKQVEAGAKELAEQLFGSSDALIRIDMSEFMEKFAVSRLVGAPPGYVGYENGGQLTEKVRRKPYSIVLLDEIEKAHQDVFNILLQVMDEGRLTDSDGRTVDFRNTIIIMTSNIGSRQVKDFGRGIGFNSSDAGKEELAQELIRKALNKSFAPEFINRIDEIITFHQLSKESIAQIVTIEVDKLKNRVTDLGYVLQIAPEVYSFLADKGYSTEYGARPLKRAIQTYLEDKLSEMLIEEECSLGDTIIVSCNDGKDVNIKIEKRL